jgi:GntR family transcriptional regulator
MELDKGSNSASIVFRLDPTSGVPTYLQLVRQVEHALRLGLLAPGDRLPTVKEVVAALAINPNTVLKAYRELEHKGLAAGRPGLGTFIERGLDVVPFRDLQVLSAALHGWVRDAADAGLDEAAMSALFANAVHEVTSRGAGEVAS